MQSIDLKKIGNEIKVRRVKQGIQQTALAEMLDITQTHLSNIENGRVPGLSLIHIWQLHLIYSFLQAKHRFYRKRCFAFFRRQ